MRNLFSLTFFMLINGLTLANPLGGDPTNGYCQTVNGSACGWSSGSNSSHKVYRIPNRWGAVYYNAVNRVIGISENNTEGYRSAHKEALENCIKAGGGKNPLDHEGEGCHKIVDYRNSCAAVAMGGVIGKARTAGKGGFDYAKDAEKEAITACEKGKPFKCVIKYSGCSRHPDYLRY